MTLSFTLIEKFCVCSCKIHGNHATGSTFDIMEFCIHQWQKPQQDCLISDKNKRAFFREEAKYPEILEKSHVNIWNL